MQVMAANVISNELTKTIECLNEAEMQIFDYVEKEYSSSCMAKIAEARRHLCVALREVQGLHQ